MSILSLPLPFSLPFFDKCREREGIPDDGKRKPGKHGKNEGEREREREEKKYRERDDET